MNIVYHSLLQTPKIYGVEKRLALANATLGAAIVFASHFLSLALLFMSTHFILRKVSAYDDRILDVYKRYSHQYDFYEARGGVLHSLRSGYVRPKHLGRGLPC